MKITKIVLSEDRNEHAVYLDDGSKLERVVSVKAEASADELGMVRATIEVLVFKAQSKDSI